MLRTKNFYRAALPQSAFRRFRSIAQPVIGIRREDKNVWERRAPLIPKHVEELVKDGIKVLVQPSTIRCYSDEDYQDAGAVITEDLSPAQTILAVKEVPADLLIPNKTYMFFSHTIKAQAGNMPLLDSVVRNGIRLIDYERIVNNFGRVVKFGPFAGYAGMIDTLHAVGLAFLARGIATPFMHISMAKEYRSLETARSDVQALGELIRKKGLPKEVCPLTFVVTGTGSVSMAAQQILHLLPCNYVDPLELKNIWRMPEPDRRAVYVAVVSAKHMVLPKEQGKAFDKKEYYDHPDRFVPVFAERIAPYTRVLVNGIYWEPKYHKLLTMADVSALREAGKFPLVALGDITCDPGGSVELLQRSTTIGDPYYCFDVARMKEVPMHQMASSGVAVLGVDHLPAEFPMEASECFGDPLVKFVKAIARDDGTAPLEEQTLPTEVRPAVITSNKLLTPQYEYIQKIREERLAVGTEEVARPTILILGAGMVSGPVVEYLLKKSTRYNVVIADRDLAAARRVLQLFGGGDANQDRARAIPLDATHEGTMLDMIHGASVVVSLLPAPMHPTIMRLCLREKKHLVTASYESDEMKSLAQQIEDAHLLCLNELGLDPGIDIMTSQAAIRKINFAGGHIESYESWCGALPSPECSNNPMGYKFSWSPQGVLRAIERPATFRWRGAEAHIPPELLYDAVAPLPAYRGLNLYTVPNGNSLKYAELYGLGPETHTVMRNTLRFEGYGRMVHAFRVLGLLKDEAIGPCTWRDIVRKVTEEKLRDIASATVPLQSLMEELFVLTQRLRRRKLETWANSPQSGNLKDYLATVGMRSPKSDELEAQRMVSGLDKLGLLSSTKGPEGDTAMGALCAHLEKELKLEPKDTDFVLMRHRLRCNYPAQKRRTRYTVTLARRGEDADRTATALTVGLPVGIAASLVLEDGLPGVRGLRRPTEPEIYGPILAELNAQGVFWTEEELEIKPHE